MYSIYSVEAYHHDKNAWVLVGYYVSLNEARQIADSMVIQHPTCRYSVFQNDICVYSV